VDAKKQGDSYAGIQREHITLKIPDKSPEGFYYKACLWTFSVELSSVTEDRIEGRWEGYPPGTGINPNTCQRMGTRIWEDVAWIRD
jgi:hypothetical protein